MPTKKITSCVASRSPHERSPQRTPEQDSAPDHLRCVLEWKRYQQRVAFYIFDYPPEDELRVRDYLRTLLDHVLDYLKSRKLLEKAIRMQREKGNDALKKALAGPLHESKLSALFAEDARPDQHGLVIVSGVGTVWPLLRTHSLLNNLQPVMGKTPLAIFYPGRYDGQSLRLFGKLKINNYHRAFKLVT
jgi:hypothetical protein